MIEIITNKDDFGMLQQKWDQLARRFNNPLVGHDWFYACAEAFCNEKDLRIAVVLSHGELVAAAPLVLRREHGAERLELIGAAFLNEPGGILYNSRDSLEKLLTGLLGLGTPLILHRLAWVPELEGFRMKASKHKAFVVRREAEGCFFVPLDKCRPDFAGAMKSKRRSDFRRAARKAEKFGPVSVSVTCPEPEELKDVLNTAFSIEAAGWKGRNGSAICKKPELKQFFQTYAALACKRKTLRLCFFHIGSSPVAMQIGVECFNRFWVFKIGHDEAWRQCSPGMQLSNEVIFHAAKSGLDAYEFLGSEENWLYAWPVEKRSCFSLGFYPFALKSMMALGFDASVFVRKRLSARRKDLS